jgi:arsenate reductase
MTNYVYYHNPRCSKSRQGLILLEQNGIQSDIKEYLKVPLFKQEIIELYEALGLSSAAGMIRKKEKEYNEAGLSNDSTDSEIIAAILIYPKLLERPILTTGSRAVIGRPIDNLQTLING